MENTLIRNRIVEETLSWCGTPYVSNALVKGKRGGTDCAMLLVGVYKACDLLDADFDPRPYPTQWHVHRGEELYMNFVKRFAKEIQGPPLPGDVVLFKIGRVHAHGAVVINWPIIIHARAPGMVRLDNVELNNTGKHALANLSQRFFSLFGEN